MGGFMKFMSILMIIIGAIGLVTYVTSLQGLSLTAGVLSIDMGPLTTAYVLWIIAMIAEIAAGILGIIFAKNVKSMLICIIFGIATAGLSLIASIIGGAVTATVSWWGIIISIIVPVIYIITAFRIKAVK